jgi:hypothetical protein
MAGLGDFAKFLEGKFLGALDQAARASAQQVVQELREVGPWWTGDFARSWEIRAGDASTTIEATDYGSRSPDDDPAFVPPKTQRQALPPVPVAQIGGRQFLLKGRYIIGNRNRFRDIAMDLQPGRWRGSRPPNTAAQDWYSTYAQGGQLNQAIRLASQPILDQAWSQQP